MFIRSNNSYDFDGKVGCKSLYCDSNPLFTISKILRDGAKILDIGAGNGILARLLMERGFNCTIDGIEPNIYAAEIAKPYYRNFYVGKVQEFLREITHEKYDYIILADVIEHIPDPLQLLKELCAIIPEHCKITMSLPNVAFGAVRFAVLNGIFDYVDSGILEKTHLRFFTLKTLESLIKNSGLNIEKIFFLQRSIIESEINLEKLKLNPLLFYNVKDDPLAFTYQFVVTLTKNPSVSESYYVGEKGKFNYLKYLVRRHKSCFPIKILTFLYRLYKGSR